MAIFYSGVSRLGIAKEDMMRDYKFIAINSDRVWLIKKCYFEPLKCKEVPFVVEDEVMFFKSQCQTQIKCYNKKTTEK